MERHRCVKKVCSFLIAKQLVWHCLIALSYKYLQAATAHVVWSYHTNDPTNPSGSDAVQHVHQGSQSVNFLGGTTSVDRDSLEGESFLDFTVTNVGSGMML